MVTAKSSYAFGRKSRKWAGTRLDLEKGVDHTLQGFDVRGANRGLCIEESVKATITSCVFAQNRVGVETKRNDYREPSVTLTNCLIADNLSDGLTLSLSKVRLDHCTVSGNAGVGVNLVYYGHVTAANCAIVSNAIGIQTRIYETAVEVTSSNIVGNRVAIDVKTSQDLQCKSNFWGVTNQPQIALLILDGLDRPGKGVVVFTDFAHKPIADAGCSLKIPKESNVPRRRR